MNLRQDYFKRKVRKQQPRVKLYRNYEQISSALILFESDYTEQNGVIISLINRLKADGKTVDAFGFVGKKLTTTSSIRPFNVIGLNDVNLFHVPHKNVVANLRSTHYDLLLDLRLHACVPLQYMSLFADADLKVGADLEEEMQTKVLDLMIKIPLHELEPTEDDVRRLFEEQIRYLKIIK